MTGGNSGIGAATATLLKQQGAKVAVFDIAESGSDASSHTSYVRCNVTSQQEVEDSVAKVIKDYGSLDILVNCAGVMDGMGQCQYTARSFANLTDSRENRRHQQQDLGTLLCCQRDRSDVSDASMHSSIPEARE